MTRRWTITIAVLAAATVFAGCNPTVESELPPPVAMTEEALGHFCQMVVLEHPGPKAQIHLSGQPAPIFFSQVRDGVAYFKSPERDYDITAFYVSDMAQAESWDDPGSQNWIEVGKAYFVIGADVRGGMGAPELVPFGTEAAAFRFAATKGGSVVPLDRIPDEAVFGVVEVSAIKKDPGQ